MIPNEKPLTISGLLADPRLREYEFPVTARKVFLAHAAASPLPRRVASAVSAHVLRTSSEGQWEYIHADAENAARLRAATLIGAHADEIAFVSSTSMGLSLVASGIAWREGDDILVADGDFPSNIYPWLNLRRRGVTVRFIPRRSDGSVRLTDVRDMVGGRTRLVSLSSVNYLTGFRMDTASIGAYLRERGVLFCVDAVQCLGAFPVSVANVDFLAAGAHKWLLGPMGIGILYVRKERLGELSPVLAGWKSVRSGKEYLSYDLSFLDGAARFEPGNMNFAGIVGLSASLGMLLDAGIGEISARLAGFRELLRASLIAKGYRVLGSPRPEEVSGITTFHSPDADMAAIRNGLEEAGIVVSMRESPDYGTCIRVAPHFYTTEEEVARFLDAIPAVRTQLRPVPAGIAVPG